MINIALAEQIVDVCAQAGQAIMALYQNAITVQQKADASPVTAADFAANDIICEGLIKCLPGVPILSEENSMPTLQERQQWPAYWLVDPLDGTKEFIERTGEFSINIALMVNARPFFGVIYSPAQQTAWLGGVEIAAQKWHPHQRTLLPTISGASKTIRVLLSRRHNDARVTTYLQKIEQQFGPIQRINMGSALKFAAIAEGKGDIYPRFSPTCEWDIAAGHALLQSAGGNIVDSAGAPISYNSSEDLLNPPFLAIRDRNVLWPIYR